MRAQYRYYKSNPWVRPWVGFEPRISELQGRRPNHIALEISAACNYWIWDIGMHKLSTVCYKYLGLIYGQFFGGLTGKSVLLLM